MIRCKDFKGEKEYRGAALSIKSRIFCREAGWNMDGS